MLLKCNQPCSAGVLQDKRELAATEQTISRLRRSTLAAAAQEQGSKALLSPPPPFQAAKCYIYMLTLFLRVLPGPVNQLFHLIRLSECQETRRATKAKEKQVAKSKAMSWRRALVQSRRVLTIVSRLWWSGALQGGQIAVSSLSLS